MPSKKKLLFTLLITLTLVLSCESQVTNTIKKTTEKFDNLPIEILKAKHKLNYDVNNAKTSVVGIALGDTIFSRKIVDLRPEFQEVYDQGTLGSCTAFSIVKGLREYIAKKAGDNTKLSALEFYYKEREITGNVINDSGSLIETGMNVLKDHGVALESDWAYDITKFTVTPPSEVQLNADKYKLTSIINIKNLYSIKNSINMGMPVVFGTKVPTSFLNIPENGVILDPKSTDKIEGGTTLVAVGYDDTKYSLIVRNSWGTSWGLQGYAYLPYTYFSKGYIVDAWTGKI